MKGTLRTGLALLAASTSACTAILGGFDFDGKPTGTGGGGGTSTTGTTGTTGTTSTTSTGGGGTGGSGGAPVCEAGKTMPCYTGPAGTEDTGLCKGGTATCKPDGSGFGECVGEVTPVVENCASGEDQDCNGTATACTGLLRWAKRFGNASASAVAVDGTGSTIITGMASGGADLGGGPVPSGLFIAKYDDNGNHELSKSFVGPVYSPTMAADAANNLILFGGLGGTMDFGGGAFAGGQIFLAKFDPAGGHVFSKGLGGGAIVNAYGVAVDSSGNIAITGEVAGKGDFGGDLLDTGNGYNAFVAKYDPTGHHLYSVRFSDGSQARGQQIGADSLGNVVVAGAFTGTLDFGATSLVAASVEMFVAKLDPTAKVVYARQVGPGVDAGSLGWMGKPGNFTVAVDAGGNAVIAGGFTGTVDFGGTTLTSGSDEDVFVAKFDALGTLLWSKHFGGSGLQAATSTAIDAVGNVIVAGRFSGGFSVGVFGPGAGSDPNVFALKLDGTDGTVLWSQWGQGHATSMTASVAVTGAGELSMAGTVQGPMYFGPTQLTPVSTGNDVYVAAFAR